MVTCVPNPPVHRCRSRSVGIRNDVYNRAVHPASSYGMLVKTYALLHETSRFAVTFQNHSKVLEVPAGTANCAPAVQSNRSQAF
jgi:hypothetical protein